jgi:hypothetical protein
MSTERTARPEGVGTLVPTKLEFDKDVGFDDKFVNSIAKNNFIYNISQLTSMPKDPDPIDKDTIISLAQSNGVKDADFSSAIQFFRGIGSEAVTPEVQKVMEDNNLWGENASADLMNSIEQTDSEFLTRLKDNGLDPYLMNKKQLNNQYYYWNSQQRPTTLASDIVSEVADPINYIPMGFASKGAMKLLPSINPLTVRAGVNSGYAIGTSVAQAKASVLNKEFLTENEKSEEIALTALFTAAITGGFMASGLIGRKLIFKTDSKYKDSPCVP